MSLISIITPCFNSVDTINDTITSVLNQSYTNWEIIICDDMSNDKSESIINKFDDPRIKYVKNEFIKGAAGSRNTAMKYASGRFICFLDSDDIWSKHKLEIQLKFMQKYDLAFTYGSYYTFKNNIKNITGKFSPKPYLSFADILKTCDIGCLTVMIDREKTGNFSFPYSEKEDYALWLILFRKNNIKARLYPGIHAYYRISSKGISANKFNEIKKQYNVLNKYSNCNKISICIYLFHYGINGLIKYFLKYRLKKI
ncbi:glycosyltransferase family 2 protein [Moellerella wisconsensis]|uniref:glycosyltransferase family 2 protein n=1 Tax=Moellerella wisconsensis TaxID=158849 RepID=UPI003075F700